MSEETEVKTEKKKPKRTFKSLTELKQAFNKDKPGTIIQGNSVVANVEVVQTNIACFDAALGVLGIPRGRIIEIYGMESSGKTSMCLQIIAAFQKTMIESAKRKGVCMFVDAEHALDPKWATKIGVDIPNLMLSQPESGEEALQLVREVAESGLVDLIVVDSVAALIPQKELDGEIGDVNIGGQAKLMSQAMRTLKGICYKSKTTVIFINQVRHKIGVMFGCVHADTPIPLVSGESYTIREIVDNKIEGEVWSYNENLKKFEPNKITGWHNNGDVTKPEDYISLSVCGPGNKNGFMNITVTPNHEVYSEDKWLPAKQVNIGNSLTTKYASIMSGTLKQFLQGVLSGDSHIAQVDNHFFASLSLQDNIDSEYSNWKAQKLKALEFKKVGKKYCSTQSLELALHKELHPNRDPMFLLNDFNWLGFTIWILDDASYERSRYNLSIKRFSGKLDKIDEISRKLDSLGLYHYASPSGRIVFDKQVSDMIAEQIAKFVPPCMAYKLPTNLQNNYLDFDLENDLEVKSYNAKVVNVSYASAKQMRQKGKYDISVANNANYLAGGKHNGVLIHNSPDTTPGGNALKFYASLRMTIRRAESVKSGETVIGHNIKMKIIKNKVAPPFKECEFTIKYGNGPDGIVGIDKYTSLIDIAPKAGAIKLKGSNYYYKDKNIGCGAAKVTAAFREDAALFEAVIKDTYDLLRAKNATHDDSEEVPEAVDQDVDPDDEGTDDV